MKHRPVLINEVINGFKSIKYGTIIDGTIGKGGHAFELLKQNKGIQIIGIDRDPATIDCLKASKTNSCEYFDRLQLFNDKFSNMAKLALQHNIRPSGILLDLGYSTAQINDVNYGLSYFRNQNLDMRLDLSDSAAPTALQILNWSSEKELIDVFQKLGELKSAKNIASSIVQFRSRAPIEKSGQLVDCLLNGKFNFDLKAIPKIFQALRMKVNNEIYEIQAGIKAASNIILPNGIIQVITFNSLELRTVFDAARSANLKVLQKTKSSESEISDNFSARSAEMIVLAPVRGV